MTVDGRTGLVLGDPASATPLRVAAVVRAGWGAVLLIAPVLVLRSSGPRPVPAAAIRVARCSARGSWRRQWSPPPRRPAGSLC
ncbi:hypothetical protein [Actinoplanes awajinensis]|nr:hypothetical protein [Actinoplanes awajinensis]